MAADDHDADDRTRAWVLNLDADLELAAGAGYVAKRSVREAMAPFVATLASSLLGPNDVVIGPGSPEASVVAARGKRGRCFCPTPSAIDRLVRAGVRPDPHPSFEVLRRVNSRAFAASLGQALPGASFVTDFDEARAKIDAPPEVGAGWRAKRAFGMSGRGQRIVSPGAPSAADRGFLRACIDEGGVQIEPNVRIEREYAMHGLIERDGSFRLGSLVVQVCDAVGAWVSTERAADPELGRSMAEECERVARALHASGYFGPFGVDAFTYRAASGVSLQPRGEVNARYTMGFVTGFGSNGVVPGGQLL